ncbi:unnamed protein product [Hanseniaspora opuntiae]
MTTVRLGIELKDLGINDGIKNISNKTQRQVITKSNIPELIELVISTNKEYFNLKDNSIYLTNIIQIYKYKTKLLLDDVTGTILHLRNVFKGQLTSISTSSTLNDNSISIFKDQGLTIEGKDNVTSKRISQQKKNNLVGDVLDATSLFQYDDLDLVDEVEFGRSKKDKRTSLLNYERYDNNTQASSNVSMSLDDIELGRNESLLDRADVSLNSSMNDALALNDQHTDPFGFHDEMEHDDILNDQGDDELDDGDYSLEQPRVMSEPELGIELDDMDLNINTPPQSPRRQGQKAMKKSIEVNDNQETISGRVNKRVLEQIYNFNDLQTLSLIDLRQLKKAKGNQVNTSIVQSDEENAGDLSLQFDNIEEPEEVAELEDDFNLMDHGSMNESINLEVQTENNSQSSYLTSTTPGMRLQREKDHIQQEMILAKTDSSKQEFKELFDTNKLNKAEVSQLFLQVLNLTTEDKIVVEQVGSSIYISK